MFGVFFQSTNEKIIMKSHPLGVTAGCSLRIENQYFMLLKEGHLDFASKNEKGSNHNGHDKNQENLNTVKQPVKAI